MGKGEFSSLARYITPEALLRYNNHFPFLSLFWFSSLIVLLGLWFSWKWNWVLVDVGGSDTESKRWRFRCGWDLYFLECSWAFSWQCTLLFSSLHFLQSLFSFLVSLLLCLIFFPSDGFSTILKGDMIWWDSLRPYRKLGFMLISALDLMFVQSGILGTNQFFSL